jgi:hypothetical protein
MDVLELDITQMNDLEIKGTLHGFIEKAKNRTQLMRFIEAFNSAFDDDTVFWSDYTPEQKAEIEEAIEESYHPENWVSHEDVMKKYAQWLKK